MLSESGPIIVHIHDRKHPQQRLLIKCPCPECSPSLSLKLNTHSFSSLTTKISYFSSSSLPIIVNASPVRRLNPPSILHKSPQTKISPIHNIQTTFFNELIGQHGRNVVISVTQCVLDVALIVSVHSSLTSLGQTSNDEFKKIYQETIDPLKLTSSLSRDREKSTDVLTFYHSIKTNNVNIRNPKGKKRSTLHSKTIPFSVAMRNLITSSENTQQIQCTPIVELKTPDNSSSVSTSARVIRLSIAPTALSSSFNPLVPKQINIIKPLLSTTASLTPAIKLSNPVLITTKPPMK